MSVPGGPSSTRSSSGPRLVPRERGRFGKILAWWFKTALNTILQKPFGRAFPGPLFVRVAVAITTGVLIGALVDLTLAPASQALPFVVVGLVAGGGAGGAGGALVGACWGWLAGEVTEAIVSELVRDPAVRRFGEWVAWACAATAGWLGGFVIGWAFERLARRPRPLMRVLEKLLLVVVLASVAVLLAARPGVCAERLTLPGWAPTFGLWAAVVLAWVAAVVVLLACLVIWISPSLAYPPPDPKPDRRPFLAFARDELGVKVVLPWLIWVIATIFFTVALMSPEALPGLEAVASWVFTAWLLYAIAVFVRKMLVPALKKLISLFAAVPLRAFLFMDDLLARCFVAVPKEAVSFFTAVPRRAFWLTGDLLARCFKASVRIRRATRQWIGYKLAVTRQRVVERLVRSQASFAKFLRWLPSPYLSAAQAYREQGFRTAVDNISCALNEAERDVLLRTAAEVVRKPGVPTVEPLVNLLEHRSPRMRRAAALALGKLGDQRAVIPLATIAVRDRERNVVLAGEEALGDVGGRQAVKVLRARHATRELERLAKHVTRRWPRILVGLVSIVVLVGFYIGVGIGVGDVCLP